MKKILILAAAAAVLCSCANKNKYAVDGKVEGANSMVYLFDEKDNILDSAAVANGVFRFEGVAEKPQAAILRDARDDGNTESDEDDKDGRRLPCQIICSHELSDLQSI